MYVMLSAIPTFYKLKILFCIDLKGKVIKKKPKHKTELHGLVYFDRCTICV